MLISTGVKSPRLLYLRALDYLELCKPKVVLLMLLTTVVGMFLAQPGLPELSLVCFGLIGIALCAGSAAAINHLVDRRIDAIMARTHKRPIVLGKVSPLKALLFALTIGLLGQWVLFNFVNSLTAVLSFLTLIGYAVIYTMFLKRATPQNIVIGGLAGAAPPLLGFSAVSNHIDSFGLLLVLIIFTWTPPHFWALAIYRYDDYKKADIPMLPVTHGIQYAKYHVLIYTVLLAIASVLPFVFGMSGVCYLLAAIALNARYLQWSIRLLRAEKPRVAMQSFRFSIVYLMLLFVALLVELTQHPSPSGFDRKVQSRKQPASSIFKWLAFIL